MILDQDNIVKKDTVGNLCCPRKRSTHYNSYISDLPEMTCDTWMSNVSLKVFRDLYLDLIRVCQEFPNSGTYTSAIQFSDGILNFCFTPDTNVWTTKIPTIMLDIVFCNYGLRDSTKRKILADKQLKVLRATSRREIVNEWSLKDDKEETIVKMYKFMKFCRKRMIYQYVDSRFK